MRLFNGDALVHGGSEFTRAKKAIFVQIIIFICAELNPMSVCLRSATLWMPALNTAIHSAKRRLRLFFVRRHDHNFPLVAHGCLSGIPSVTRGRSSVRSCQEERGRLSTLLSSLLVFQEEEMGRWSPTFSHRILLYVVNSEAIYVFYAPILCTCSVTSRC